MGESDEARALSLEAGSDLEQVGCEPIGPSRLSKPAATERSALASGLYVVATPIGNAGDITLRALAVLREVAAIACEDTRVSDKLLRRHGIGTPRLPYHEHNAARMRPRLLARLIRGEAIALISDAGTPLVSDPGFKLVRAAIAAGVRVTTLPGASAPLAALVLSGLPCDRFFFAGFLPAKEAARRRELITLAAIPATLLFLEAGPRLAATLEDMSAILGNRPAAVARELTKLYEEVRRERLETLAAQYRGAPPPRGEITIAVGPPEAAEASEAALDAALKRALTAMSLKDASLAVAAALKLPRRTVYARALALTGGGE